MSSRGAGAFRSSAFPPSAFDSLAGRRKRLIRASFWLAFVAGRLVKEENAPATGKDPAKDVAPERVGA